MEKRFENDIKLATMLQQAVISKDIHNKTISISGYYVPAHDIGGDMYVWHRIDEHRYGILLLDVMGHGVSAALISMSIWSLTNGIIARFIHPHDVIKELNNHIFSLFNDNLDTIRFVSAIYLLVDTDHKKVDYCNAGNPAFLVLRGNRINEIESTCSPLGIHLDIEPRVHSIPYDNRTKFLLYTDGLLGVTGYKEYPESIKYIKELFLKNKDLEIQQWIGNLVKTAPQPKEQDDISVVNISF